MNRHVSLGLVLGVCLAGFCLVSGCGEGGMVLFAAAGSPLDERAASVEGVAALAALIGFALLAIGLSFLCSIAEAVLLSVTPSYIATLKDQGKRSAAVLEGMKANIDRPLSAILSLNTIAHTVGAAGVGAQAARIWGDLAVGWASAAMTLAILILSEIIPKTIGAVYWRSLAPAMARLVQGLVWGLYPLVWLSELMTRMFAGKQQEVVTREEVVALAAISVEGGQLEQKESRVLGNLFRLRSLTAHDIMTPRPVIVAFEQDVTVGDVLKRRPHLPVSRIPIYERDIDKVTGFVLKPDILLAQAKGKPETRLADLRRDLTAVPASASLLRLFDILLPQQAHIALVADEYGGTEGLVTMEDLLETLLGMEIVDEADEAVDMQKLARERWRRRAKALELDIQAAGEGDDAGHRRGD